MVFQFDDPTRLVVRVTLELARAAGEPRTFDRLARDIGLTPLELAGVLAALMGAELVTRDEAGYALAVEPERLCLADVVAAADPSGESFRCQFGQMSCTRGSRCHPCWAILEGELRATEALSQVTVAELLARRTS